jgi:oligopeptidase B
VARKSPKVDVVHGDRRVDDYFWLREKSNPDVAAYLQAENAYTDAVMKPTEGFQEALYREMLSHIKEADLSAPYRQGGYFYHSRTEEGKQYPLRCRKKETLEAPEEIILDLNELAKGHDFLELGIFDVSDDGNLLAYSTDTTGFREYTLFVKDLRTGQLRSERIEKVDSAAWANDNATMFYVTEDPAKRPFRLYRHRLGADRDDLVYEEKDRLFRLDVLRTRSKAYLLLSSDSLTASEVRYLAADRPGDAWKLVAGREAKHEYDVDHHGDHFYIRTNDRGRNFRLVLAPASDPRREDWKEVIPHRPDVMLEGMEFFRNHSVLFEREDGLPRLCVTDLRSGDGHRIEFPEPAYTVSPDENHEFDTRSFRYSYQSFITPNSVFEYDMEKRTARLLKQTEVPGGYDPGRYESERLYVQAADGSRIPVSIVYKKDLRRDGTRPMLLNGYGAYGLPQAVRFSSHRLCLLDRGVIFAVAHIRGGGEMGKAWHDQGRMMNKKNTFTDFIAAAEYLVAEKYTSRDRLAIEGGSAGGLLVGAVLNMRPDLFMAAILTVPFVDAINTMLDASLPLTVSEYQEWGNPAKKEEYDYIKTYCPYTNLRAGDYPSTLVKASFNDSLVMYWEPAKYTAKLRTLKTDKNPLLLKTNMAAGHGGASGRYDYLRELALDYAFVLEQLGITKWRRLDAGPSDSNARSMRVRGRISEDKCQKRIHPKIKRR